MHYANVNDMVSRFGETEMIHASDRGATNQIDATVVGNAINDAVAVIDGHLAGRYALPLSTVPAILTRLCCDLARYYLDDLTVPEKIQNNYDNAMNTLGDIAKGKMSLGLPRDTEAEQPGSDIEMQSAESVWSRSKSQGFI